MKKYFAILLLTLISLVVSAEELSNIITEELAKIEINSNLSDSNYCTIAKSTNKLIALGNTAVPQLSAALLNKKVGLKSKWEIARALGEIGSENAIPALEEAYKINYEDNTWIKHKIEQALNIIRGHLKRDGKVYLYKIGVQTTRTDCETGLVEIVK